MGRLADSIGVNRVVLALSSARLADALGNSILFILIPLYVAKLPSRLLHLPEPVMIAILIAVYGFVNAGLQPVVGGLADRMDRRKPLIQVGLAVTGLATLSFLIAAQFSHLLLVRVVQGLGVAMTIPASMAVMATATQQATRGGSMGVYSSMRMVGFAIGPVLGGFLFVNFGFEVPIYVAVGFVFLAAAMVQLWVHEVPAAVSSGEERSGAIFDRQVLSGGILWLGFATFLMANSFSMMTTLQNEFNARLGQSTLAFGVAFSATAAARLVTQIPLGRVSDRIGRKPLIVWGLIFLAPATALLGLSQTTAQLTAFRALQGVASAAVAAPAFALAADLARVGGEGRQMSVITTGFFAGLAVGPLMAGALAVQQFELPFFVGGAMTLVGAWVVSRYVPESVQRAAAAPLLAKAEPAAADDG